MSGGDQPEGPPQGPSWLPPGAPPPGEPPAGEPPSGLPPPGQPGAEEPPAGRPWRPWPLAGWRLAVLAVVLVVVAGGGALVAQRTLTSGTDRRPEPASETEAATQTSQPTPTTTTPPQTDEEITARLRVIQDQVAETRGLDFRREVPAEIHPTDELAARLLEEVDEDTDEEELRRYGRALELLGQLPEGTDLPQLLRDLHAEGVLGYYVPGTDEDEGEGRLYVRGDQGLTPFVEWVLAHELDHAVTDQHFDLTYSEELDEEGGRDDEVMAYTALVEGDATLLMQQYLQAQMLPEAQLAVAQEGLAQTSPKLDAAPAVLREALAFPYEAGLGFVQQVFARGGWDAVNRVYADPPTSTEQILHPERYLGGRRDEPQPVTAPDVSGQLGSGWAAGLTAGWGEADTRWLLAEELPNTAAAGGAQGWDGGLLTTFERGRDTALALRTVWDSAAEATEYCQTASRWATGRFGQGTPNAQGATWAAGGQHTAIVCTGDRAAWLSAPDSYTLQRLQATLGNP